MNAHSTGTGTVSWYMPNSVRNGLGSDIHILTRYPD